MTSTMRGLGFLTWAMVAFCLPATAAETIKLTLKDHRFTPAEITVPSGERFKIELTNQEPTAAEFESKGLKIEKIVAAGGTISVMAGPVPPGSYLFVDEYHEDEAKGTITAVAK